MPYVKDKDNIDGYTRYPYKGFVFIDSADPRFVAHLANKKAWADADLARVKEISNASPKLIKNKYTKAQVDNFINSGILDAPDTATAIKNIAKALRKLAYQTIALD